jgi:hypothetical protein
MLKIARRRANRPDARIAKLVETGRTSIGRARLTLLLWKDSGGRIARESASLQSK